jgi:transmembrane sensor
VSTESSKRVNKAAGDWLAKRDSEDWTDADQLRLDQWLAQSPAHRVAFLRIEHVWQLTHRLKALGAGTRPHEVPRPGHWILSPFVGRGNKTIPSASGHMDSPRSGARGRRQSPIMKVAGRFQFRALAASVALLGLAVGTAWYLAPSGSSYRTPIGGIASVPMSDGSNITLNTDSEIRVALTAQERRVELDQGEAFFEVTKNPARPFVVRAGNKRVIAVGTQFSVRRDAEDLRIVVTEGKVRVETESNTPRGAAEPLTAGTIALASDTGVLLQKGTLSEAEDALSWRTGTLIFREVTLADAAAEFNRYNTRKVVIEDPKVAALHVAGRFRATNVDAFVRLLERGYALRAEDRDNKYVLKGY